MVVEHTRSFVETSCVPRVNKTEHLEIEMMANSWQRVLKNVPNDVTSFRTAVRIPYGWAGIPT